jgi:phosphatidyl-myo-inositol dimannoside synthase
LNRLDPVAAAPAMLALVPDAFGGRGGIAQYNRDFLGALVQVGAVSRITVVPRQAPDRAAPPEGIEQTRALAGRAAYTVAALRAARSRRFEIVFCGHLFMVPLAALAAKLTKARLIVQTHGIEAWPCPSRLQRAALESADLVLCVSRHTRSAVLGWSTLAPERVIVVPNTVRDDFTPGPSATGGEVTTGERRVLLSVGRMDASQQYKGQDRVIAAIPHIVALGHDVHYLIAGEGDDRPRLEALVAAGGVRDRVHFLGAVALDGLVDAYRAADLFVMPSSGEGFGIAYLEAMASGTRALGLNLAGAIDALAEGQLGTVVAESDLASSIAALLSAPKPDPRTLSTATRARFGRERFVSGAASAIGRLMEPA